MGLTADGVSRLQDPAASDIRIQSHVRRLILYSFLRSSIEALIDGMCSRTKVGNGNSDYLALSRLSQCLIAGLCDSRLRLSKQSYSLTMSR